MVNSNPNTREGSEHVACGRSWGPLEQAELYISSNTSRSPLTPHPLPLTPYPSLPTPHFSPLTPHPSHLTPHSSGSRPCPAPVQVQDRLQSQCVYGTGRQVGQRSRALLTSLLPPPSCLPHLPPSLPVLAPDQCLKAAVSLHHLVPTISSPRPTHITPRASLSLWRASCQVGSHLWVLLTSSSVRPE